MKASCTLRRTADGSWLVGHASSTLGCIEVVGPTREAALTKMRNELQYRWELCPCSGVSLGSVELEVQEGPDGGRFR